MCARVCVCVSVCTYLYGYLLDIFDMYINIKNHRKNCIFFSTI